LVISVAFSPDGKQVISGSYDNTIQLWDAVTGASLQIFEGHIYSIMSVAFSPDSKQVASGSCDKTVRLWDATTGESLKILEGHTDRVMSVAFSPDGKQVISSSEDMTIRLWDTATGVSLPMIEDQGHTQDIVSMTFPHEGKLTPTLHVSIYWIVEGTANILWLPSDFRPTCLAVRNVSIVLEHPSGQISFFVFTRGAIFITDN
jgi:WD40 repeat protein